MTADDIRTLILEHERVLQGYEDRLDRMPPDSSDPQTALFRSQIEFFALNVRVMKSNQERELHRFLEIEKAEADFRQNQINPGGFMPVAELLTPPPFVRPVAMPVRVLVPGSFMVVPWADAPEILTRHSPHGGDEEFAAVFPKGVSWDIVRSWGPVWAEAADSPIDLPFDGSTLLIGAHA